MSRERLLVDQFVKMFTSTYRYTPLSLYNDFLMDCLAPFGMPLKTPWSERKTEVLFNIGREYRRIAVKTAPLTDILGPVHMELASKSKASNLGQFFTPKEVSKLMAYIAFSNGDLFETQDTVRLHEPSVGSGATVLAALDVISEMNTDYLGKVHVVAIDLDAQCCREFCLQMLVNALEHEIQIKELNVSHGNTLGPLRDLSYFWGYSTSKSSRVVVADCATPDRQLKRAV